MKKKIILTRGIQGSGKSTWAKQWVAEDPDNRARYNSDDMRCMFGPYNVKKWEPREQILNTVFDSFMIAAMNAGRDIVVDNMNLSDKAVSRVEVLANTFNETRTSGDYEYEIEFKDFFDVPLSECIRRDAMRPNPIGATVIKRTFRQYKNKICQITNRQQVDIINSFEETYDTSLPDCVIADMDATICWNVSGRPFYGQGCAEHLCEDEPNPGVIRMLQDYLRSKKSEDKLIIVTGRDEASEIVEATQKYVKEHVADPIRVDMSEIIILYRKTGDFSPGNESKIKLLQEHVLGKWNIRYAIDDSKKVVASYRNLGITVLQPNDLTD